MDERISYKFQTDLTGNNEVDGVSNGLLLDAWVANIKSFLLVSVELQLIIESFQWGLMRFN